MGSYRFVLALLVAASHAGVTVGGRNPGVVAVISFFLLSGYVMTALMRRRYHAPTQVGAFYIDRASRIFPQYLLFLLLTATAHAVFRFDSPYLAQPSPMAVFANLTVVPLDFIFYLPAVAAFVLIPQAWSLGLELTFYLAVPWVLYSRRRGALSVASFAVWSAAAFGVLNTDVWGYRLLPGTLFIFLMGSYVYDQPRVRVGHPAVMAVLAMLACSTALFFMGRLAVPYTIEVVVGAAIGLPLLFVLASLGRHPVDAWLGDVSYGLFLSHFLVLWGLERAGVASGLGFLAALLLLSTLLGWWGYRWVEAPVMRWRHAFRARQPVAAAPM